VYDWTSKVIKTKLINDQTDDLELPTGRYAFYPESCCVISFRFRNVLKWKFSERSIFDAKEKDGADFVKKELQIFKWHYFDSCGRASEKCSIVYALTAGLKYWFLDLPSGKLLSWKQ